MNNEYINDSDNDSYKQHDDVDEQRYSFGRPGEFHDFDNDNLIDGWDY